MSVLRTPRSQKPFPEGHLRKKPRGASQKSEVQPAGCVSVLQDEKKNEMSGRAVQALEVHAVGTYGQGAARWNGNRHQPMRNGQTLVESGAHGALPFDHRLQHGPMPDVLAVHGAGHQPDEGLDQAPLVGDPGGEQNPLRRDETAELHGFGSYPHALSRVSGRNHR